jgi:propanol-preferring alcohol dehydrogenase
MRALVVDRPGPVESAPLRLRTIADPEPGPGDLLLRVAACAVCRTDLQIASGDLRARRLPIVPGHQAVGVVEAVGRDVQGWRTGDRAGVT